MTEQEYDLECIGLGVWPRSLRSDSTHYLEPGRAIYAEAAHGALMDAGYVPGTTALPGAPTNLTGGIGTLTWEPPADDGDHPIQGYLVEGDVGGGFVAVAIQGSPSGFTKQYIRSMTGLAAGDYRVSAITAKGMGSPATAVTVT